MYPESTINETESDRAFILAATRLQSPPHLPEIQLHLADEIKPIWEAVQIRLGDFDATLPFWAFAWAGGLAIARYLLDHPGVAAGKRVVDIATGSGLCAIAACKAGAASVMAADIDPLSLVAVELNAGVNRANLTVCDDDLLATSPPDVDLILAGDIGYERQLAEPMLAWLNFAHMRGIDVLIGDPERTYFPSTTMKLLAVDLVTTTRELESGESKRVGIYTFPGAT
jgi:predicted nicotinamide N-methyase